MKQNGFHFSKAVAILGKQCRFVEMVPPSGFTVTYMHTEVLHKTNLHNDHLLWLLCPFFPDYICKREQNTWTTILYKITVELGRIRGLGVYDVHSSSSGNHFDSVQTKHLQSLAWTRSKGHIEGVYFGMVCSWHDCQGVWPTAGSEPQTVSCFRAKTTLLIDSQFLTIASCNKVKESRKRTESGSLYLMHGQITLQQHMSHRNTQN